MSRHYPRSHFRQEPPPPDRGEPRFLAIVAVLAAIVFAAVFVSDLGGPARPAASAPQPVALAAPHPASAPVARGPAFRNCTAARAAGAAPVYRGDPGYGAHLDADGDGIGCEPYRR